MAEVDIQERVQQIIHSNDNASIQVHKPIELEIDTGNLLVTDKNELNKQIFKSPLNIEWYLQDVARDCVQVLLNNVWDLPNEIMDDKIYALLPPPITRLPREKKVPRPKEPTKWERYAKEKGIAVKKKAKKTYDETLQRWVPTYGMKKSQAEKEKNWVREVPGNADPFEDQFAKAAEAKKERVAKNEFQRLKNIARERKLNRSKVGVIEKERKNVNELNFAIDTARVSTASLGKFQKTLPNEKPILEEPKGKKRKKPDNALTSKDLQAEKKQALDVIEKITNPQLNLDKAVDKQIAKENVELATKKKEPNRRSKQGGRKRGKSEQKAIRKGLAPQMGTKSKKRKGPGKSSFGKGKSGPPKGKSSGNKRSAGGRSRGGKRR